MALIKCENCGREISDKANACPGCGHKIEKNISQCESNKEVLNETKKKTTKAKVLAGVLVAFIVLAILIVLGTSEEKTQESDNAGQTEQIDEVENNEEGKNVENIEFSWSDGDVPTEVGGGDSVAQILDTKIVNSSYGTLLVMSFEYTNNSNDARNFINDSNCRVQPFQNGVALDSPGITSEEGVYDTNDSYTSVKNGGVINSQLAWILKDNVSSIEIEFGLDENYDSDFIKTINLSGGSSKEENNQEIELAKSDYKITWSKEAPETIGNENEKATIKNIAVVDSANYGTVLVIDIDFVNNLEDSRNLINNMACNIRVYQSGVELDSPGVTSDSGYFNYNEAFTAVKKGGKVSTQLVWSLRDESPVEIEFGLDENYEVQYLSSFTFKK